MTSILEHPGYYPEGNLYLGNFIKTLDNQHSLVHHAILHQRIYLLQILLAHPNLDINLRNQNYESPLLAAVKLENKDAACRIIEILLKNPAIDVNSSNANGDAPLHEAVKDHLDEHTDKILTLLLEHPKIDVNIKNYQGESPLHLAATVWAVTKLLDKGASVNLRDNALNIPLHKQVKNFDICKALVSRQIEINAQNIDGLTPLHEAVWHNSQDTIYLLLESGADPNIECEFRRRISALALSYQTRCSPCVRERLCNASKPIHLMFTANYDTSKYPRVLETWASTIQDERVVDFIIELINLLRSAKDLNWITCSRLICDYFLQKVPVIEEHGYRRVLRKFRGYMNNTMINFMLKTHDYRRPNSLQEVTTITNTLLEIGDHLIYSDLDVIFVQLGDCRLLHEMIKRPIYPGQMNYKNLSFFVRILLNTPAHLYKKLAEKVLTARNLMDFYSVHCLARYCTLTPEMVSNFKMAYEDHQRFDKPPLNPAKMDVVMQEMDKMPKIRSLTEMSRDVVRQHVSRRCKTNRTWELYCFLQQIGVPPVLIDIILLQIPIYYNIPRPQYMPHGKHLYIL